MHFECDLSLIFVLSGHLTPHIQRRYMCRHFTIDALFPLIYGPTKQVLL